MVNFTIYASYHTQKIKTQKPNSEGKKKNKDFISHYSYAKSLGLQGTPNSI